MAFVPVKGTFETKSDALDAARRIRRITGKRTRVLQRGAIKNGSRPFVVEAEIERKYVE